MQSLPRPAGMALPLPTATSKALLLHLGSNTPAGGTPS